MDINDLFSSDWWTTPTGKAPVSQARDQIEPVIAPMRNGQGSLDPANVTPEYLKKYGITPSASGDVKEIIGLGQMRSDAMKGATQPPAYSPLENFGALLSAASVPVAYAQGNRSFGQAMTGRTLADQGIARKQKYQDAAAQDHRDIVADTFGSVDKTVQSIQANRRERQQRALSGAEVLIRQGKTADAITLLKTNGLTDHATELETRMKGAAQGQGPGFQNAPATQPSSPVGGPVSSPVPGISVTPPQGAVPAGGPAAPAMPGAPGAGGPPAPPQGVSPMGGPTGGSVIENLSAVPDYRPSPAAQELIDQAQFARSMGREDLAKQLDDQAKAIDTSREVYAKKDAERAAEERVKLVTESPDARKALQTTNDTLDGIQRTVGALLRPTPDGKGVELSRGAAKNVGGLWDTMAPNWPGSEAASAWANIEKLKSNIGVMVLNAMREASKTGGAVGNVTEKEWPILQNQLASLDPNMGDAEFAQSLIEINDRVEKIRTSAAQAYTDAYGRGSDFVAPAENEMTLQKVIGAPVGTEANGYVKTEQGWVPKGSPQTGAAPRPAAPATPVNKATFLRPQARG